MIDASIESQLSSCLGRLPVEQQRQVLDFARALVTASPTGVRGSSLLGFAGTIDAGDLNLMEQAIQGAGTPIARK